MDKKYNEIINELRGKIKSIITLYEVEKEKNLDLAGENKSLTDKIKVLEDEIYDIKNKYNNIKVGKAIALGNDDSHDAKIKINRIVREIDKCIALLNQ